MPHGDHGREYGGDAVHGDADPTVSRRGHERASGQAHRREKLKPLSCMYAGPETQTILMVFFSMGICPSSMLFTWSVVGKI